MFHFFCIFLDLDLVQHSSVHFYYASYHAYIYVSTITSSNGTVRHAVTVRNMPHRQGQFIAILEEITARGKIPSRGLLKVL